MASTMAASTVVGPVAFAASAASATSSSETVSVRAFGGLKAAVPLFAGKSAGFSSVQNGSRVNCMQVRVIHLFSLLDLHCTKGSSFFCSLWRGFFFPLVCGGLSAGGELVHSMWLWRVFVWLGLWV